LEAHRRFYADVVTSSAGVAKNERLKDALASTPRERFVGAGPWKVFAGGTYIETPTDDPAFLYQDVVVAIAPERRINNGQPLLHALSLAALNVQPGEKVLHVGAGTGYYSAVLARLTGATGTVVAYEVEHDLAQHAVRNLSDLSSVTVQERSGAEAPLPACDAIYVNAGRNSSTGRLAGRPAIARSLVSSPHFGRWPRRSARFGWHASRSARCTRVFRRAIPVQRNVCSLLGSSRRGNGTEVVCRIQARRFPEREVTAAQLRT
jgi:protein-L-isoaspartate O-methyltransferase